MITLLVAGLLLLTVGAGGAARAGDGCCGGTCGGAGLFNHAEFVPNVTYYAPYPYWYPQYFAGPAHSDYLIIQYTTPPAESALIVKERILAINMGNPALLPMPKEPLPYPKPDVKVTPEK